MEENKKTVHTIFDISISISKDEKGKGKVEEVANKIKEESTTGFKLEMQPANYEDEDWVNSLHLDEQIANIQRIKNEANDMINSKSKKKPLLKWLKLSS